MQISAANNSIAIYGTSLLRTRYDCHYLESDLKMTRMIFEQWMTWAFSCASARKRRPMLGNDQVKIYLPANASILQNYSLYGMHGCALKIVKKEAFVALHVVGSYVGLSYEIASHDED